LFGLERRFGQILLKTPFVFWRKRSLQKTKPHRDIKMKSVLGIFCPKRSAVEYLFVFGLAYFESILLEKRRKSREKRVIQARQTLFSLSSFLFCPVIRRKTNHS
jgi:hypothetical protein